MVAYIDGQSAVRAFRVERSPVRSRRNASPTQSNMSEDASVPDTRPDNVSNGWSEGDDDVFYETAGGGADRFETVNSVTVSNVAPSDVLDVAASARDSLPRADGAPTLVRSAGSASSGTVARQLGSSDVNKETGEVITRVSRIPPAKPPRPCRFTVAAVTSAIDRAYAARARSQMETTTGSNARNNCRNIGTSTVEIDVPLHKKSVFQYAFQSFKELFINQKDHFDLERIVRAMSGTAIRLRNPSTWYLIVRSGHAIPQLKERDFCRYAGRETYMCALGVLAVRKDDNNVLEQACCALLMDENSQIFVYDWRTDGLLYVASSLLEFSDRGLRDCEAVYRNPLSPYLTTRPEKVVQGLICLAGDSCQLMQFVKKRNGCDVTVVTPDQPNEPLKLLGSVQQLQMYLPYSLMDDVTFNELVHYISVMLQCPWFVLGAVGKYSHRGEFLVTEPVIVDAFSAVYLFDQRKGLYRIADDLCVLFRGGFHKRRNMRFDRNLNSVCRVEKTVDCLSYLYSDYRSNFMLDLRGTSGDHIDMENAFTWLLENTDYGGGWKCRDKFMASELTHDLYQTIPPSRVVLESRPETNWGLWSDPTIYFDRDLATFRCPMRQVPDKYLNMKRPSNECMNALEATAVCNTPFTHTREQDGDVMYAVEPDPLKDTEEEWDEKEVWEQRLETVMQLYNMDKVRGIPFVPSCCPRTWYRPDESNMPKKVIVQSRSVEV